MPIGHETPPSNCRRLKMRDRSQVDGSELGKDTHIIVIFYLVAELNWHAIHQDEVNLRMRHPNGFDYVFDRPTDIKTVRYNLLPLLGRKEVIQLRVKSEAGLFHSSFCAGNARRAAEVMELWFDDSSAGSVHGKTELQCTLRSGLTSKRASSHLAITRQLRGGSGRLRSASDSSGPVRRNFKARSGFAPGRPLLPKSVFLHLGFF